jgi:hypothetical protein
VTILIVAAHGSGWCLALLVVGCILWHVGVVHDRNEKAMRVGSTMLCFGSIGQLGSPVSVLLLPALAHRRTQRSLGCG